MIVRPRKLKAYRTLAPGVCDLLKYAAMVADGVCLGKDGSFMAMFKYQGPDNGSCTVGDKDYLAEIINAALSKLGSGWIVGFDGVRTSAPGYPRRNASFFPDRLSLAMDEERRRHFECVGTLYESQYVLTATYLPPLHAERKFVDLLYTDEGEGGNTQRKTNELIAEFEMKIKELENALTTGHVMKLTRLKSRQVINEDGSTTVFDDFLSHIQFCVTGFEQPVRLPDCPLYLDALIGGQELRGGVIPQIGKHYIQCVSLEGFPAVSQAGILEKLNQLPVTYRFANRFIPLDSYEAELELDRYRKKWGQKIRGVFDQVFNTSPRNRDLHAEEMEQDVIELMGDVHSGCVGMGYYTSVVVLMDRDRKTVETNAARVQQEINALGFVARIETINTLEAYLGSLPGHGVENVRRPLLTSINLAHFIPTSGVWTGRATAPCPFYSPNAPALLHAVTDGHTPFRLNLHVGDLGHTKIVGKPGSGKSTLLGILAVSFLRYINAQVFAFDKGMSLYALTKALGGQHYIVAGDEETLDFCPLQFLESQGDRAFAGEWLDGILTLNGLETTPEQRNEIATTLILMHKQGGQLRSLTDFCLTIQDKAIRSALQQYIVAGSMGHLLDAKRDGLAMGRFMTFEIEELMNLGERYCLPVLLYLFRRIEKSLKGQPSVILLDEAWLMLQHPVFKAKIHEWLKTMRKANCAVIMATQSLSDFTRSDIADVIISDTATKIFLPNQSAKEEEAAVLYQRFGLNERQIDIIATAVPKKQYYVTSDEGQRLFDLALGPLALAFVGVSDKDSVAKIKQCVAKFGDQWVHEYLRSKNLRLEDYV